MGVGDTRGPSFGTGRGGVRALAAVLLFALAGTGHAEAAPQALSLKAPDAAEMVAAATADGGVRVIVEFATSVVAGQIEATAEGVASAEATVAAAQEAILTDHFGSASDPLSAGFDRALRRMSISPMFAINVSAAELETLANDPRVARIFPDRIMKPQLVDTIPLIGMPVAYALGATGTGYAVGVIDSGVQASHDFLVGKVLLEHCISTTSAIAVSVSLCPNGQAQQDGAGAADPNVPLCFAGATQLCFHGTTVAGVAAGFNTKLSASEPANGVARSGALVAVQINSRFNTAAICGAPPCVAAFTSDAIAGLDWVFANALTLPGNVRLAAVVFAYTSGTASASTCDATSAYKTPFANLRSAGIAVVVAAGDSASTSTMQDPACVSSAISVASSTKADAVSPFSDISSETDLIAPGGLKTVNPTDYIQTSYPVDSVTTGAFGFVVGTSLSAAHVAGAFLAMRSACPTVPLTSPGVTQMLDVLKSTGVPIADARAGGTLTKPRIQVDVAVEKLLLGCVPSCTLTTSTNAAHPGDAVTVSWTSTFANSGSADNGIGGLSPVAGGSKDISFDAEGAYLLTATFLGPGGSQSCQAIVLIYPAGSSPGTTALDPLTLFGLGSLAAVGWRFRRRRVA